MTVKWTNSIHGEDLGNVAQLDGSAQQTTTFSLREILPFADDGSTFHILPAF
jgi:hypothetical protein